MTGPLCYNVVWTIVGEGVGDRVTGEYQDLLTAMAQSMINTLRAKFFRGNINIYLHFVSFLHIDATQVFEILPQLNVVLIYMRHLYPKISTIVILCGIFVAIVALIR